MNRFHKILIILSAILVLYIPISPSILVLADEIYYQDASNQLYTAIQTSETSATLIDNINKDSISIEIIDYHNFILIDIEGNQREVFIDGDGNVYLDGTLELTQEDTGVAIVREEKLAEIDSYTVQNSGYIYLDTFYYDTKTQGDIQSITLGLLSLVPYVGPIFGIAGIINTFKSLGHQTMYVKVNRYYSRGFQFYKYDSFFYSNPARTHLVTRRTEIKQMW